jgi:hypothetical protein
VTQRLPDRQSHELLNVEHGGTGATTAAPINGAAAVSAAIETLDDIRYALHNKAGAP